MIISVLIIIVNIINYWAEIFTPEQDNWIYPVREVNRACNLLLAWVSQKDHCG